MLTWVGTAHIPLVLEKVSALTIKSALTKVKRLYQIASAYSNHNRVYCILQSFSS